jgi:hypothetical protein
MYSPEDSLILLKLHKSWPERDIYADAPGEALLFQKWLLAQHGERPSVPTVLSAKELREFLQRYRHVLRPVEKKATPSNQRREPRIENHVGVLLKVASSPANASLIGTSSKGRTLDLGLHGMRIKSHSELPSDGQVDIAVTPRGFPLTVYNLAADTKWARRNESDFLMGFRLRESKDFERWHREFGDRFVSKSNKKPT